jgi:predicted methyltransferase
MAQAALGLCLFFLAFLLAACRGGSAAVPARETALAAPARRPAQVMSFESAGWLERPGREEEERPEIVLAAMRLRPGQVVAEIGCGSGFFARRLARAVAPGGRVYAEDIQPEMLDLLRERAAKERIANIVPVLGTDVDPRLPQGGVDWVLMADVYHEFQRPQPMLARIKDSLAPGGQVALVEYREEGETASQIKPAHRMSAAQVLAEWQPAGFELVRQIETLPSQHLFFFRVKSPARSR